MKYVTDAFKIQQAPPSMSIPVSYVGGRASCLAKIGQFVYCCICC